MLGKRAPDLVALAVLILVGGLLRAALLYRIPPLFMPGDSQSFLLPGYDLSHGLGFDPIIKRPLGYPLVIAAVMSFAGEDLTALVAIQSILGVVTVIATYWIGWLAFGRSAGFLAGLLVAIGGQLLIYEHFILAESIFATLLTLGVLGLIASVRLGAGPAVLGGFGIGAAVFFRPVAEVVLPIVVAFFLFAVEPRRRAVVLTLAAFAGFLVAFAPAAVADTALRGGPSAGAVGEHLIWRLTRSDTGYFTRDDAQRAEQMADPARRYVVRRALDRTLPQEIYNGLRREFGLTPAQADRVMLDVALEAIARNSGRYLASTARMAGELFLGEDQRLGDISKRNGDIRYSNPQSKQRTWFEDRILHLAEPPAQTVQNEFERAELLTGIYQPGRWGLLPGLCFIVGTVLALLGRPSKLGLLPAASVLFMLVANAAMAGPEARFRYPMDPLIGVVAAGGLVGPIQLAAAQLESRIGFTRIAALRPG